MANPQPSWTGRFGVQRGNIDSDPKAHFHFLLCGHKPAPRTLASKDGFFCLRAGPLTHAAHSGRRSHCALLPLDRVQLAQSTLAGLSSPPRLRPIPGSSLRWPRMLWDVPASTRAYGLCQPGQVAPSLKPSQHPGGLKPPLAAVQSPCGAVVGIPFNQGSLSINWETVSRGRHLLPSAVTSDVGETGTPRTGREGRLGSVAPVCFFSERDWQTTS